MNDSEPSLNSKKEGRKVLWALIAFFVTFASVDVFFVYKAVSTHSGVVSENAYEQGLNYNDILDEAKKRRNEQVPNIPNTPN